MFDVWKSLHYYKRVAFVTSVCNGRRESLHRQDSARYRKYKALSPLKTSMEIYVNYKTSDLNPNPFNDRVYGVTEPDTDLMNSIRAHGVLEPLIIKQCGMIISGHRRWRAALEVNMSKVPVRVVSFDNDLDEHEAIIEYNRQRVKTFSQKMAEADELREIEVERAKARMSQGGKGGMQGVDTCPQVDSDLPKTRDAVAKQVGIGSGRTYDRAHKVWIAAKEGDQEAQELVSKIDDGKETINSALKTLNNKKKKAERDADIEAQRKAIEESPLEEPPGEFEVVAIDPPWPYGRKYDPEGSRVANPYPEMSIDDLSALSIPSAKDGIMFLWATHQFLPDAFGLLQKWGFNYKATIVWDKEIMGMGAWLRMQCEFCLVGIKGKPTWDNTTWRDVIREKRREHSRKPEAFYNMVEGVTVGRKLDYFSRQKRDGWWSYGNDIGKF